MFVLQTTSKSYSGVHVCQKFYHNNSFFSIQTISEAITTLTHQSSSFCIHFIALRLISPHGDKLVNLMVDPAKAASVEASATRLSNFLIEMRATSSYCVLEDFLL